MPTPAPPGAPPTGGARFGKYRIVRRLGRGAFGSVYLAVLPGAMGFTKTVAIKRLRSDLSAPDSAFVKALVNEARIGGLLHHPNIVDVFEFDRVGPHYYLAMEYIDGVTLAEVVELSSRGKARLPRAAIVDVAMQACRGLQYAHAQRDMDGQPLDLIHRDLKPSNLMLDLQGTLKICDFGIAKAASNLFEETATGFTKGTPRYMSPDQLRAETPLRPRSDVFALGTVLFELITARPLFGGDSLPALTHQIVFGDIRERLDDAERALPGCGEVLSRALERDAGRRFPSAEALGEAFRPLARRYPLETELSRVVAALVDDVERTGTREIRGSGDLDFAASDGLAAAGGVAADERTPTTPWAPREVLPPPAEIAAAPPAAPPTSPPWTTAAAPVSAPREEAPAGGGHTPRRRALMPLAAGLLVGGVIATVVVLGLVAAVLLPGILSRGEGAPGPPMGAPPWKTGGADPAGEIAAVGALDPGMADPPPAGDAADADASTNAEPGTDAAPVDPADPAPVNPDPAPATTPPPPADGTFSFFVEPWARAYLDGAELGSFSRPAAPYPVAGGAHRLRLVCDHDDCPDGGREQTFALWIDGDRMTVDGQAVASDKNWFCWDFTAMARCD